MHGFVGYEYHDCGACLHVRQLVRKWHCAGKVTSSRGLFSYFTTRITLSFYRSSISKICIAEAPCGGGAAFPPVRAQCFVAGFCPSCASACRLQHLLVISSLSQVSSGRRACAAMLSNKRNCICSFCLSRASLNHPWNCLPSAIFAVML